MSVSRAGRAATLLLALALPGAAVAGPQAPRRQAIVLDGDVGDWALVLASPANAARDDEGSGGSCGTSTDRDCPVQNAANDLLQFAWTWDDSSFFFFVERVADRGPTELLWIFLDADADSLMESGEPIVQMDMDTGEHSLLRYWPSAAGGDPLAGASGFADGYRMPGLGTWESALTPSALSDTLRLEGGVAWSTLGVAAGGAMGFHVAAGSGPCSPANVDDAMGGAGGAAGTTGWRGLSADPAMQQLSALPGQPLLVPITVTSSGNVPIGVRPSFRADAPIALELWLDTGADGTPDTRLAIDGNGDGDLLDAGDALDPAGDSDADGRLDLGVLPGGSSVALLVALACPAEGTLAIEVIVTDAQDSTHSAAAVAAIKSGAVTLQPDRSIAGVAGDEGRCAHVLRNNGAVAVTVDLELLSAFGWTWALHEDVDGDGDPGGDPPLADADGSGLPDVTLAPGASAALIASVAVPPGAAVGLVEYGVLTALVSGRVAASVTDRVTVRRAVDLTPNHLAAQGTEHRGAAGGSVYFAHRVVNALPDAHAFELTADSPEGWTTSFLSDPDRDGRPADAEALGLLTPPVPGNGGSLDVLLRVDLPAGASPPAGTRVTLRAASPVIPSASDDAFDEAVAAIVTTWEDAGHVVSLVETPPCSTVHALASGVPGAREIRFEWRDPLGQALRVQSITSDGPGRASDSLDLPAGADGAGYTVDVRLQDGTLLDTTDYAIVEPLGVESLAVGRATHPLSSVVEVDLDVVNASFLLQVRDASLRLRVLTSDTSLMLDGAGEFVPWTTTDWTATLPLPFVPRDSRQALHASLAARFPAEGTHVLQAWLEPSCGPARLAASVAITAIADRDADGRRDDDELAAGTSPDDADSDDDGLDDGAEGVGDADGDGTIDALACDADGDGLPDGLESGVAAAGADTDPAAGCFAADTDPATTTDPRDADSDGGGLPDGSEDRDGDGARDPGEKDPRDGTDDRAGCAASLPEDVDDLRAAKGPGASLRLSWSQGADACAIFSIDVSDSLPSWTRGTELRGGRWDDASALGASRLRCYVVTRRSELGP